MGLVQSDWQDVTNKMQGYLTKIFTAVGGSYAKRGVEALLHGLSRLVNIDLSSRLGGDTTFSFGEPKSTAKHDVENWLFATFAGAPLGWFREG
jgi:hypothetical protein